MTEIASAKSPGAARLRSALWYAIDVLTPPLAIFAVGLSGLRLGQELAQYLGDERQKDLTAVLFTILGLDVKRGFLLTSISVGGAGILIKSTMEFMSLAPTMVTPAWQAVRQRFAFKDVAWPDLSASLVTFTWSQWKTLAALLGVTASLGIAILLWEPDRKNILTASVIANEPVRLEVNKQVFDLYQKSSAADIGRSALMILFEEETAPEKRPFGEGLRFSGDEATEDALTIFASRLAYCNRGGRHVIWVRLH